MRARIVAVLVSAGGVVACGPERMPVTLELGEVCGQTEPVRILEFEPGRELALAWSEVIGERRVIAVRYADAYFADKQLWSVGMCGEMPRKIDSGIDWYRTTPRYGAVVFAYDEIRGEVRAVDVTGAHEPKFLFTLPGPAGTPPRAFDHGFVGIWPDPDDETVGSLILQPWPGDLWTDDIEPVVLVEGVRTHEAIHSNSWEALAGTEDEAFVQTVDDEFVRVSLPEGTVEVIANNVQRFGLGYETVPSSRRYLIWQHRGQDNEGEAWPEGEVVLLDRATGERTSLGTTALARAHLGALRWSYSGVLQLPFCQGDECALRVYSLPSLSYVDAPGSLKPMYMLGDDRHLIVEHPHTHLEDPLWSTLDVKTGEVVAIEPTRYRFSLELNVLALLDVEWGDDGELWVKKDGGPAQLAAKRASGRHRFVPDGRLLSMVEVDENFIGDLIAVDPDTHEELLVDKGVLARKYEPLAHVVEDDTIVYPIVDGHKRGLWLARLPPRN